MLKVKFRGRPDNTESAFTELAEVTDQAVFCSEILAQRTPNLTPVYMPLTDG